MAKPLTNQSLAEALIALVKAQNFEAIADPLLGGRPLEHFPSIDVAVVAFPRNSAPVWASVIFHRDLPDGHVCDIGADAGAVRGVRYLADQTNEALDSISWLPGADWSKMAWETVHGDGPVSTVLPYPGSMMKVLVLVGAARLVDAGRYTWEQDWTYKGETKPVAAWADSMIVASNNIATEALTALLHAGGLIVRKDDGSEDNQLHELFTAYGLPTLKFADTQPGGGWRSADGAGVGSHQMTSWDTVRLLWLLLNDGPAAPWMPANAAPILSKESRRRVWAWMGEQGLHEILSSTTLAGLEGWREGIPSHLPARWVQPDGSVKVEEKFFPGDVRPYNATTSVSFLHKTGNTDNYASNCGLVQGDQPEGRRYLISFMSNLGRRYRACQYSLTDYRVPALGGAIDRWLAEHLE